MPKNNDPIYEDDFDSTPKQPSAPKKPWEDGYIPEPDEPDAQGNYPGKVKPVNGKAGRVIPYNQLGLGRQEAVRSFDAIDVALSSLERDASGWVKFRNWARGIITIVKRGFQPLGSMADCKNFQPNTKIGALQQRFGYSAYISPPLNDIDDTEIFGSIDNHFHLATEFPESKDIDVITQNGWAQKPYWNSSATAKTAWLKWGDSGSLTVSAIAGDKTTITFSGGSSTNDFYNNVLLFNSTRSEYVFIQDYVGSTGVATPNEKIPSDWVTGDTYLFYRHFHDNPTPFQSITGLTSPNALAQGNSILASGGQSSNEDSKFMLSLYLDTTYFTGLAKTPRYWGTYVTEAEIKSDAGFSFSNASAVSATNGLDTNYRWFIGFVYRTVDGQLSTLVKPSTDYIDPSDGQGIRSTITVQFPRMNKRIRYIEVFLGRVPDAAASTSIDWNEYFHAKTIDMTDGTGWTYSESTTAPGSYSYPVTLSMSDWNENGEQASLVNWTGTTEYNRSTLSSSYFTFHNGRLFAVKSYDHTAARNLDDEVSWSSFSGALGTPQYNVLPDVDGFSQGTVESGDADSITGINKYQTEVIVTKNNACYRIDTGDPEPANWRLNLVARVGCDAPNTLHLTPYGLCWLKTNDDIYIYRGGYPESLTQDTIQGTVRARTSGLSTAQKLTLWGWYNQTKKAYELMLNASDTSEWWSTFFELPVGQNFAWFRNDHSLGIVSARVDKNGNVLFASTNVYKFDTTLTDAGTAIATYFDTGVQTLDERNISHLRRWHLAIDQDASATRANDLDVKFLIDGAEYTYDSVSSFYSALTKTKNRFESGLPLGCRGRTFQFQFNTDATPATFTASGVTSTPLTILELGVKTEVVDMTGDVSQTL